MFDAEVFAVYEALRALDQRRESGRGYTVFVDSTATMDRIRTDEAGPGQRFAIAAAEVCDRCGEIMRFAHLQLIKAAFVAVLETMSVGSTWLQ